MTEVKFLVVLTYALASASLVGVVSMAMHTRLIWPGMLVSFCISLIHGVLVVRGRS